VQGDAGIDVGLTMDFDSIPISGENPDIGAYEYSTPTGISQKKISFALNVFPNPCSNKVMIRYNLMETGEVTLTAYDINGRKIKSIFKGSQQIGIHTIVWDTSNQSQGIYLIKVTSNNMYCVQKISLID